MEHYMILLRATRKVDLPLDHPRQTHGVQTFPAERTVIEGVDVTGFQVFAEADVSGGVDCSLFIW
jgi:hypothetical protein